MEKHSININVYLDKEKMPEHIDWDASGSVHNEPQQAKAFMAAFWDPKERTALRMDLWTKKMMVDEMNDFFFQSLMTMADSYVRATRNDDLGKELKEFARDFKKKADEKLIAETNEEAKK